MIQIIWEFSVKENMRAKFLRYYSSAGLWASLFRKNPGYRETKLLQDTQDENRYFTIDIWENEEYFEGFIKSLAEEYDALNKECEEFTEAERNIGLFKLIET